MSSNTFSGLQSAGPLLCCSGMQEIKKLRLEVVAWAELGTHPGRMVLPCAAFLSIAPGGQRLLGLETRLQHFTGPWGRGSASSKDTSESLLSSLCSLVQGSSKLQSPPARLSCAGRWRGNAAKDPPCSLPLSIHLLWARNKQEQPEHNGWVTQVGVKSDPCYSVARTLVQITVTPGTFRKHSFQNPGLSLLWMLFRVREKKIRLCLFSSYGSF